MLAFQARQEFLLIRIEHPRAVSSPTAGQLRLILRLKLVTLILVLLIRNLVYLVAI